MDLVAIDPDQEKAHSFFYKKVIAGRFLLKRQKEYGVLRAMGVTGLEIGILICLQVVLINLVASATGVVAGMLTVWILGRSGIDLSVWTSHNRYFAATALIFPRLSLGAAVIFVAGCGHWAYLGVHGTSIRQKWGVHANVGRTDEQCLECHHPDNAQGSAAPHPDFTGCLKCHND